MAPHRPQCQGSWAPRLYPALAAGSCRYSRHRACFRVGRKGDGHCEGHHTVQGADGSVPDTPSPLSPAKTVVSIREADGT